jgi:hypothetical protein
MRVGRKGAFLLLAIVTLWATIPLFACAIPAAQHSCCRAMMRMCNPSVMMDRSCCQLQHPNSPATPTSISGPERPPVQAGILLPQFKVESSVPSAASQALAKASPPLSLSGSLPILRI